MQQEMARYNQYQDPRMNLASTLGGLLGGGAVNVAQGRNFFESNNPVLKKASQLQEIYNTTAQSIDPTANPGDFYRALQGNLAAAGFGPQAAMAAQEAYKFGQQEREMSLKERQVTAQEKNVSPFAQGNYMSESGPLVFNRETGGYTVNGEPYSEAKHGKATFAAKEDFRSSIIKGSGAPGAGGAAPKGKDGKPKKLSKDEQLEILARTETEEAPAAATTASSADQYIGKAYGPNTPDAVLAVGVNSKNPQALAEAARRQSRRDVDAQAAQQGYGF
jgi:hypothetical protein